jgi:hypothetical protein
MNIFLDAQEKWDRQIRWMHLDAKAYNFARSVSKDFELFFEPPLKKKSAEKTS